MNIGLVLSGGMVKGAYQIGALKAIQEYIPHQDIKYISCASVGTLNSYAYVTDNLETGQKLWEDLCPGDTSLFLRRVLKGPAIPHIIDTLYGKSDKVPSNFYVTLLNLATKNVEYTDLSKVDPTMIPQYLNASVAFPVLGSPAKIDDISYLDGGTVDNIPVHPLLQHDPDYVICVYFDDSSYKFENTEFDKKVIKIVFMNEGFIRESFFFSRKGIDAMIAEGYRKTHEILEKVFAHGHADLPYIYNAIEEMDRGKLAKLRVTADVLITNLNKVMQKLTKRKILD